MNRPSIFITGITSGIGQEVLGRCLKEDFDITGVIRNESKRSLIDERVSLLCADLANRVQVQELATKLADKYFDYVVFNAGCGKVGDFHKLPEESIDDLIEANLLSNMRLTRALLPNALKNKTKLVFVSSLVAILPGAKYVSYATSKAGLSHFYASLKKEYPQIPMLCIEIGAVDTPIHQKSGFEPQNKALFKSKEVIAKRLFDAIKNKEGVHTLSLDWALIRKAVLLTK